MRSEKVQAIFEVVDLILTQPYTFLTTLLQKSVKNMTKYDICWRAENLGETTKDFALGQETLKFQCKVRSLVDSDQLV